LVSKSFSIPLLSWPANHTIYYFIVKLCLCYLLVYTFSKLLDLSDLFYIHIHADSAFYQTAPISTLSKRFVSYRCILHHCIFTKLSCINMPNISYVVLRRYCFFCNLYLKSINGSSLLERGRCSLEYFAMLGRFCSRGRTHEAGSDLTGFRINFFKNDFSVHYFVFVYS